MFPPLNCFNSNAIKSALPTDVDPNQSDDVEALTTTSSLESSSSWLLSSNGSPPPSSPSSCRPLSSSRSRMPSLLELRQLSSCSRPEKLRPSAADLELPHRMFTGDSSTSSYETSQGSQDLDFQVSFDYSSKRRSLKIKHERQDLSDYGRDIKAYDENSDDHNRKTFIEQIKSPPKRRHSFRAMFSKKLTRPMPSSQPISNPDPAGINRPNMRLPLSSAIPSVLPTDVDRDRFDDVEALTTSSSLESSPSWLLSSNGSPPFSSPSPLYSSRRPLSSSRSRMPSLLELRQLSEMSQKGSQDLGSQVSIDSSSRRRLLNTKHERQDLSDYGRDIKASNGQSEQRLQSKRMGRRSFDFNIRGNRSRTSRRKSQDCYDKNSDGHNRKTSTEQIESPPKRRPSIDSAFRSERRPVES